MKLSPQQSLVLDALREHTEGCETSPGGCCMRWLNKCGYRYGERVHELRKKGYQIPIVQVGRGHWHYFLGEGPVSQEAPSISPPKKVAPQAESALFTARRIGNVVREEIA